MEIEAVRSGVTSPRARGARAPEAGHPDEEARAPVRGALGHPTATATRTEPASLARERDQPIEAAGRAAEPRKPAGEPAAPEKIPKLLLDEAG
jgi:hypothetical protein